MYPDMGASSSDRAKAISPHTRVDHREVTLVGVSTAIWCLIAPESNAGGAVTLTSPFASRRVATCMSTTSKCQRRNWAFAECVELGGQALKYTLAVTARS